ncbi:hypothetical protein DFJ77DRAFT_542319 [Powellomyces hirtus]|nr:hypothetical protein DFJ77DRAFT_542319 [Powellomyces hirtus]
MAFSLLDRQTAIDPDKAELMPTAFNADFQFFDLVFQYPTANASTFRGEFTLKGFEGQSLTMVGPSGSGKSTIIGLLERWFGATEADALPMWASRQNATINIFSSHSLVTLPEPVLFDMSIAGNIAERPVTINDIMDAAKQADVYSFNANLPGWYDTRTKAARYSWDFGHGWLSNTVEYQNAPNGDSCTTDEYSRASNTENDVQMLVTYIGEIHNQDTWNNRVSKDCMKNVRNFVSSRFPIY